MNRIIVENDYAFGMVWASMKQTTRIDRLVSAGVNRGEAEEYAEVSWTTLPMNIRKLLRKV